jgi:hypothetical protein
MIFRKAGGKPSTQHTAPPYALLSNPISGNAG